jgi:uncharacterized OB-fold protein
MERELYAYRCKKCDTLHYPFRMVCKGCRGNDFFEFEPEPLPRKGKLLTWTRVYNLPAEFEVPVLGLGIVELENGIRVTGQVEIDQPELGMDVIGRIGVVRRDAYENRYGMIFRAA